DDNTKTLTQKVQEAEAAMGTKLTAPEIATLGGFFVTPSKPEAGPDLENDAGQVFANLSERFSSGKTTPLEDREFLFAVTNYVQPRQIGTDDSGLPKYGRDELPEYVKKALQARGYDTSAYESPQTEQPVGADGGQQQQPQGQPQQQGAADQRPGP